MTEKQARRLGVGCTVYHIVRCLHGMVAYFNFNTVNITWENGHTDTLRYDQMQDIERRERYGR